jgi:hypothetical protein
LKGHGFSRAANQVDALKGHGFSRAANQAHYSRALAPEGCLFVPCSTSLQSFWTVSK